MFRVNVLFRLLGYGFKSDMNFHFDFFCGLFSSILWIGLPLVFFKLIFLNIEDFNGWEYSQILFLVGSYTIVDGMMMGLLIRSMGMLESDILNGNLDHVLLKPFDTQLFYAFRSFNLVQFVNTFFGLAIVVISCESLNVQLNPLKLFLYILSLVCGCIIYYSIWFLITISSFWFPTKFSKVDVFLNYIGISKYPYTIFTGINRLFALLFIPSVLIANPALLIFLEKDSLSLFYYQLIFTVFLMVISCLIFKKGLKKYESAGR
ncbi:MULTISPECIES: ABC transporter permease [unclassified Streptococcus]|uniref:ABC transporter permease n=1 Tax=unclassified Streptococcus TaxID=2608887 RepID=UPI00107222EC|nr:MULTISPECIES: ABC-2 family transporter protein [unclassified Streptococcus]MCQ9212784.1 ABC-2 family transporter protein [Streptococcus sp. B01]MCQ9214125.1 ABC-2 family transporter protein [Streptococcus sp. O1]TFV05206.1 multidrug transporter [Streptococcus sp. LYSM12]